MRLPVLALPNPGHPRSRAHSPSAPAHPAGKGIVIGVAAEHLGPLMEALRPEGVLLALGEPDPAATDAIVATVAAWR